jgi:hypothetical protein
MNTCEPNMRFHLIDGFLDSFSCGLGWVRGHASRASFVGPRLCSCDAFIGSSHVVPLRASHHFFNNHTRSFPWVNISRHASKGESKTLFLTKFCIMLTLMISWVQLLVMYLSHGFPIIYRLTFGDPRLRYFSLLTCRIEVLGWRTWALTILVLCLEWLRYEWFFISLFSAFNSPCCNVTSLLTLWAFSYTILRLQVMWNLFLCSLDHCSMFYNCSILHLASCAGEVC